jgi:hypothetical protein
MVYVLSQLFERMRDVGHTERHPLESNPFVMPSTEVEPADDGTTLDDLLILPPGSEFTLNAYTIKLFDKGGFFSFGVRLASEIENEENDNAILPNGRFRGIKRPERWKNCMHKREPRALKCSVCAAFGRLTTS